MRLEAKITRKRFLQIAGSLIGSFIMGYGYSRFLEPRMIRISRRTLPLRRLPDRFIGKRIVHFSDIHLDYHFGLERLERLAEKIRKLEPDMLCFTGDLYHEATEPGGHKCAEVLRRLEAPLGKWAVLGNHDYIAGSSDVGQILEQGGFKVLMNRWEAVETGGQIIQVAGIDDIFYGKPDFRTTFDQIDESTFTLLLAHEPDLADQTLRYPVDLQLSGHSHGGQIRLPFIGHVIVPEMARKYPDGLYTLGDGKLHLYTNRGIGVSTYPFRLFCPPEITVITLAAIS